MEAWPDVSRADIVRAADDGYRIFKIHTNPLEDIFEWTKAIEEVAPPGFRVHYDFTGRRGRRLGAVLPIVARLERDHPIVQWIEDPFDTADIESWRELRRRTQLPIVHGGVSKLGAVHEAQLEMADAYMMYPPIGNMIATAPALGWDAAVVDRAVEDYRAYVREHHMIGVTDWSA